MNKCESCIHYKAEYAPYINRMVRTCELDKRNPGCVGNYEESNDYNFEEKMEDDEDEE